MADDLHDVILKIRETQRRYGEAKARLHAVLPQASGPHDIANHLLSYAEEFGVAKTIADVRKAPSDFDMIGVPQGFEAPLEEAHTLSIALDELVAMRERRLGDASARPRLLMLHGREFAIDRKRGEMVFADTGETHRVDPALLVDEAPQRTRKRRRDRSR